MGNRRLGQLFVLEGPDGVGKTTLSALLTERLREAGRTVHLLSFPGREPQTLGDLIYRIHHEPQKLGLSHISEVARQALHIAAHLETIQTRIIPMLESGADVVLDRYWWSTFVYGKVGGVNTEVLHSLIAVEKAALRGFEAKIAFFIKRSKPIDRDVNIEDWTALLSAYEQLARMENAEVVENESSIDFALDMIERRIRDVSEPIKSENRDRPDTASANSVRIIRRFAPAIPTIVMETYWRFAAKRQEIFFQRLAGGPQPWSDDPILSKYKFTNAYRASDRVSQYLIRNVIYKSDRPSEPREVLFRILLFKIFNKIETWCLLESKLGELCWESFDFLAYDKVLKEAMDKGTRIYSAAYIMPPGGSAFGYVTKHQNHLALIERMIKDDLALKLQHSTRMQDGFELFTSYPTIGDFLGYQLITDVNYSELTNYSEMEFVVPGPGAKDGLRKAFADLGGLTEAELIRYVADYQDECFAALGLEFKDLFGRKLQLIDCQNLFCEVDKYSRQAHPQISGITGRTRIKQLFTPNSNPMEVWFPPKWKINDKLGETLTLGSGGLL